MPNRYDYVFTWMKKATKPDRHFDEMEDFAKKHPALFMKYHGLFEPIVQHSETDPEYIEAREKLIKLFSENEEDFQSVLDAIKTRFSGKYF